MIKDLISFSKDDALMKKGMLLSFFLIILCLLPSAVLGEQTAALPPEISDLISADCPRGMIVNALQMQDDQKRENTLVLVENQNQLELFIYQQEKGVWQEFLRTAAAIPQGKYDEVESIRMSISPQGSEIYTYRDIRGQRAILSDGLWLHIWLEDTEKVVESVTFHWERDTLHLKKYQYAPGTYADIESDRLIFSNIGDDYVETVMRTINTDIRTLDFYALPHYSNRWQDPPLLQIYPATFETDQRLAVYVGPGTQYPRSGNGKGVVSTNGQIDVMGEYSGYLFIRYGISDEKQRYGWVSQEGLKEGCTVPPIVFDEQQQETLITQCTLTDDPLCSKASLITLKKGTQVDWLASLDEKWAFVRVKVNGKIWFGFIPRNAMEIRVG